MYMYMCIHVYMYMCIHVYMYMYICSIDSVCGEFSTHFLFHQVSSKVHNQLLQIADERAHTAEQKALQLEREVQYMYMCVCVVHHWVTSI